MTRFRKVVRDLADTPGRTALAILAMAAGIFGVGTMLTAESILTRELDRSFADTNPASAIVHTTSPLHDADLALVHAVKGVVDVESRPSATGRIRVGRDEWAPLVLFSVADFNDLRVDTFRLDSGSWPRAGEIVIERSGMSVARARTGQAIDIRVAGVDERLRIAGTVHAAGLAPGWMDHMVVGYVGGGRFATSSLHLTIACAGGTRPCRDAGDAPEIRKVADAVAAVLRAHGTKVLRVEVPAPGRHPHADQMETFIFLLGAFGLLTLLLGAVLVANMIHALLANQLRQLGVMKAIGASTMQLAVMSLAHVATLAACALLLALPAALAAGRAYARFASMTLNTTLVSEAVPLRVFLVESGAGLLVPLLVALVPILRAARISIHEALGNDLAGRAFGVSSLDRALLGVEMLPRTLLLSLRTTLHRRGRLLLAVATLAVGGGVFIAALNVSASWDRSIEVNFAARRYDIDVSLAEPAGVARLERVISSVPDVTRVESWIQVQRGDVTFIGLDLRSPLLALPQIEGRWIRADGEIVLNQALAAKHVRMDGVRVVGVVRELGSAPAAYGTRRTIVNLTHADESRTRNARVVTRSHSPQTAAEIEQALQRADLSVSHVQSLADFRRAIEDHLVIIDSALFFAAALVVLVGALGLVSTVMLGVVSRTREIGVMSAMGASPRTIAAHIVFEGALIGLLSWFVAVLLSIPATWLVDRATGRIFIKTPVEFLMSPRAIVTWLVLVLLLGAVSSLYPAWRATRISLREALSYE